ncbi:hypothetical protein LAZ67_3006075 [Cordylochernes scorpioides]|uniref:Sushi domain-containing protein n=1 Tax=Cordylochernes scorpioides TaxID=51811 RepID=A0ABY6KEC3_9ARAC|nr:hypothetical protein LAZ67_3006075 [Cordylochernes scorpioides]
MKRIRTLSVHGVSAGSAETRMNHIQYMRLQSCEVCKEDGKVQDVGLRTATIPHQLQHVFRPNLIYTYSNIPSALCCIPWMTRMWCGAAEQRPMYRTGYACEGTKLDISCEPGHYIHLIRANYGRFSISICNEHGTLDWSVDCTSHRSFRVMSRSCSRQLWLAASDKDGDMLTVARSGYAMAKVSLNEAQID